MYDEQGNGIQQDSDSVEEGKMMIPVKMGQTSGMPEMDEEPTTESLFDKKLMAWVNTIDCFLFTY